MKIKLDRPVDYTSMNNNPNSMSIGNKTLENSDKQNKNLYVESNDVVTSTKKEELATKRVDRLEASEQAHNNNDYSNVLKQRNDKNLEMRKGLLEKNSIELTAKSDANREINKKEIVERIASSNSNSKRVRKEFTDTKEKISTKFIEQNDNTLRDQSELRENKRKLLAEIQKTNENKVQIQNELKKNKLELNNKSNDKKTEKPSVVEIVKDAKDISSLDERKAALFEKVLDNTTEDASIKQKLSQYKRELAVATAKREKINDETENVNTSLEKIDTQLVKKDSTESKLEKVRELISEQTTQKKITEMLVNRLELSNDDDNNITDVSAELNLSKAKSSANIDKYIDSMDFKISNFKPKKSTKIKLNTNENVDIKVVAKKSKPETKATITNFSNQIPIYDSNYKSPNLTAFDITLLNDIPNISNISNDVTSNSTAVTSANTIDAERQEIISQIATDTEETTEIQQKLREYQAQVRKINSEINSLTDESRSNSILSYKNSKENEILDSMENPQDVISNEETTEEDASLYQMEAILESEHDLDEVEVMLSTQEELNSAIKMLATEIKQEELLAKIEEQEQAIAKNKILEKRESLIELAQQNNELLRTLNERLSIITKKVTKSVIYTPTIITRKNKMVA